MQAGQKTAQGASEEELGPGVKEPPWTVLAVLGGAGLALYLGLSLWVFLRQVGPSLKIEHPQRWAPGVAAPLRVELRDEDGRMASIDSPAVSVTLSHPIKGERALAQLPVYEMRRGQGPTRAQAMVKVPADWPQGPSQLKLGLSARGQRQLTRSCDVRIDAQPAPARAAQAIGAADFVQDADPSDPQPKGYFIEMRAADLPRAALPGRFWIRLTDNKGKPVQGQLRVRKVSGEFRPHASGSADPDLLLEQALTPTGLASFEGTMLSERLGVLVQILSAKGSKVLAQRKVFVRAFPGSSALRARLGRQGLEIKYNSLVTRRRASIDVFDAKGRWVALLDPPVWPDKGWRPVSLDPLPRGILQLEAYAGVRTVQPSIPATQVRVGDTPLDAQKLAPLLDQSQARLSRWPKAERSATQGFLDALRQGKWSPAQAQQIAQWLMETLPAGRFAAPLVQDTRQRAQAELEVFRARWKTRLRWLLWGGYLFYAAGVGWLLTRYQHKRRAQLSAEMAQVLDFGAGVWLRMLGVLLISSLCVWLLGRLMEALV